MREDNIKSTKFDKGLVMETSVWVVKNSKGNNIDYIIIDFHLYGDGPSRGGRALL